MRIQVCGSFANSASSLPRNSVCSSVTWFMTFGEYRLFVRSRIHLGSSKLPLVIFLSCSSSKSQSARVRSSISACSVRLPSCACFSQRYHSDFVIPARTAASAERRPPRTFFTIDSCTAVVYLAGGGDTLCPGAVYSLSPGLAASSSSGGLVVTFLYDDVFRLLEPVLYFNALLAMGALHIKSEGEVGESWTGE